MTEIDRAQVEAWGVPAVEVAPRYLTGAAINGAWAWEPNAPIWWFVRADAYAAAVARAEEAERRRDAWRAKADGYDELAAAVRAGIADAGRRNLSRVFLRGALVDSDRRLKEALARAEAAEAHIEATAKNTHAAMAAIHAEVARLTAALAARDGWRDVATDPPPPNGDQA